jgi:uncharacterized protein (DUF1800 family)
LGLGSPGVPDANGFLFDPNRHDFTDKVFLGRTIRGSGISEGEEALDILAAHPSTARHISFQLAQYFVSDDPPVSLVDRLAKEFLQTRGDIRSVLNVLFHSPEFWDTRYAGTKFKTPYEYVISAVRVSSEPLTNTRPLRGIMAQLGMPLYGCLTPDGYKNTQAAWLNPTAITQRITFAIALGSGRLPINRTAPTVMEQPEKTASAPQLPPRPVDSASLVKVLAGSISGATKSSVESSPGPFRAALILGSPDFMYR